MGKASVYKSEASIVKQGIRDNVKLSAMNRQGIQNVSFNSSGSATKGLAPLNDKSKLSKAGGQIVGSLAFSHNLDFISSGTISSDSNQGNSTTSKSYLHLVPEGSASSDTLNNLTGRKYEGQIMILTNGLAGSTITLTHTATGEGQFTCPNATDYDLVYPNAVMVIDDPTQTPHQTWKVIGNASTTSVANSSITFAKIQDIATMKVIGRTSAGSGVSSEISILDEDTMSSNSATALATQQSIKAYVLANSGSTSFSGFTADATLDMNNLNIEDVNSLKINSGSANSADSFSMFGAGSGGAINLVDDNDTFQFQVDGALKLSISDTVISLSVPISVTGGITTSGEFILTSSGLPTATNTSITSYTGDLNYNALTGDSHFFKVNGTTEVEIDADGLDIRNGWLELEERNEPSAPVDNHIRLYIAELSGKTRLMAKFATGVAQQIAIEP
tara:strand:+ start:4460 stop:5797 length:1338 start_codon:yes stop_codon:yes gene_type:complete